MMTDLEKLQSAIIGALRVASINSMILGALLANLNDNEIPGLKERLIGTLRTAPATDPEMAAMIDDAIKFVSGLEPNLRRPFPRT
jgi:hypothetical protein